MRRTTLFPVLVGLLVAWGALAFGAEYAWAYAPLLWCSAAVGLVGVLGFRGGPLPPRALLVVGAVFTAGVVIQMLPLPALVLDLISPSARMIDFQGLYLDAILRPDLVSAPQTTLSIAAVRTAIGLAFWAAFALLLVGLVRGFGVFGVRRVTLYIVGLGALVALVALVHGASRNRELVYGFWLSQGGRSNSAPLLNPNRLAGWLVMAMSLGMGAFARGVGAGMRGVRPGWRNRVLWFSSSAATEVLLEGAAVIVMAIAVVRTGSRAGLLCLAAAVLLAACWQMARQPGRGRKLVVVVFVTVIVAAVAARGRVAPVLADFARLDRVLGEGADDIASGSRLDAWRHTADIIRDFPWTGTGLNTYSVAMLHYDTDRQEGDSRWVEAHNDYLQLVAEGGLVLAVPALAMLLLCAAEVRRRFRDDGPDADAYWVRAGAVIGIGAVAVQELVDFTLQMPGAVVLFVVLVAVAMHRAERGRSWHDGSVGRRIREAG